MKEDELSGKVVSAASELNVRRTPETEESSTLESGRRELAFTNVGVAKLNKYGRENPLTFAFGQSVGSDPILPIFEPLTEGRPEVFTALASTRVSVIK